MNIQPTTQAIKSMSIIMYTIAVLVIIGAFITL